MKKLYTALFALGLAFGANAQISTNLVAHYPFNNSLNDVSSNNHHLSGYGHLFGYDRNGSINECMYFDSTANSGKDSVMGITQLNDQELTISFWVNADSNYWNSPKLLNTGFSNSNNKYTWSIELRKGFSSDTSGSSIKKTRSASDSTTISFYAYNTNFSNYSRADLGVPNNQWTYVTVTFKANDSIKMYINGMKNQWVYSSVDFPYSSLAGVTDKLGFGDLNASYFNQLTKLDEFKIYNKKATDAEVMQMYTSYPLAIKQLMENNQVQVYPNPATNSISFNVENVSRNATASIFSIDGKLVATQAINNSKSEMNISSITKGMYVLQIKNGEQLLTSKFIKE